MDTQFFSVKGLLVILFVSFAVLSGSCGSQEKKVDTLTALLNDPNAEVRRNAVVRLSKMGGSAAVPALIKALGDKDKDISSIAKEALVKAGEKAVPALIRTSSNFQNYELAQRASNVLVEMGLVAAPALVEALGEALGEETLAVALLLKRRSVAHIIDIVGEMGISAVPALVESLKKNNSLSAYDALLVLSVIEERLRKSELPSEHLELLYLEVEAVPELMNKLSDDDAVIRCLAAEVLYKIDSSKEEVVVATLEDLLNTSNEETPSTIRILEEIGTARALDVLSVYRAKQLKDEDEYVRREHAFLLSEMSSISETIVPDLVLMLKDEDTFVRMYVAIVLYRTDNTKHDIVVPLLSDVLFDANLTLAWWDNSGINSGSTIVMASQLAVDMLREIGTQEAMRAVEKYEKK